MPPQTTYNGWTNYPTWAVALWLDNDEGSNEAVLSQVEQWSHHTKEAGGTLSDLAGQLREYVHGFPSIAAVDETPSLAADVLGYALGQVDWHELAVAYVRDYLEHTEGIADVDAELNAAGSSSSKR